jgi:hypothetical protein
MVGRVGHLHHHAIGKHAERLGAPGRERNAVRDERAHERDAHDRGLNVVDFTGSARVSGAVTLPANGNVAFHMVVAIDSVVNAFASLISTNAVRDFQLEANSATVFAGRMNVRSIGESYNLAGGPWSGLRLVSVVFDRTGAGTMRVLIGGIQVGTAAYSTALDSAATLALMTNRNQNAYVDGAVCEVVVTGNLAATADHSAYLAAKWGIA